jgi:hypothetical protein
MVGVMIVPGIAVVMGDLVRSRWWLAKKSKSYQAVDRYVPFPGFAMKVDMRIQARARTQFASDFRNRAATG